MSFLARAATRIINEVKGRQPGGLRRDVEAAGDDRVGVRVRVMRGWRGSKSDARSRHPDKQG